jgi:uncharacterized protein YidB (DUF937 family)
VGILDNVLGGVLGHLGQGRQGDAAGAAGGLNPKMMLALGLLAMLAMRSKGGNPQRDTAGGDDVALPGGVGDAGGPGGLDLGSLLGGLLGGQGGAAGNAQAVGMAAGGLGALRDVLADAGLGEQIQSWIGTESNRPVSPAALSHALQGTGALESLASTTGMSEQDVAAQLSEGLPELVDQMTPQGQLPPAA